MKFLIQLRCGSFLADSGEPTAFASMATLFNTESVANVIAIGIEGAKVLPVTPIGDYKHENLRESEYFRHLEQA